jgi:uncharacterized protein (TIGR00297 family)
MTLADSAGWALGVTAVCAVLARLVGALTTGGAVAGAVVGTCVSLGFGLPGLAVLGTFFVVGTAATRIGWQTKKARGTAEAGEGRRDWRRVLGKGGVAAAIGMVSAVSVADRGWSDDRLWFAFAGATAAALADTLGTEIGTLRSGRALSLPQLRLVPSGTPGAVSALGTFAAACGALAVADCAWLVDVERDFRPRPDVVIAVAGLAASLIESIAVGCGLRAPGFLRNVLTTTAGAAIAGLWIRGPYLQ